MTGIERPAARPARRLPGPLAFIVPFAVLMATAATAQDLSARAARLMADASVSAALEAIRRDEPRLLDEQVRLCEVPAPPFHEQQRAAVVRSLFQELGLHDVRIDTIGNVLGVRPGADRPNIVLGAHLDTIFPEGTAVTVSRRGTRLSGPGIADNCRGLAVLLGVVRALNAGRVATTGTITFVANVGEEGTGNSRGVRHLFETELAGRIDQFIAIDGAGEGFTHVGLGSERYKVTFSGPGGHSFYAFGMANPIHALGRAIAKMADLAVPTDVRTTFSVGRTGGGTSVNAIASEAWLEVDMRSEDPGALSALSASFFRAVEAAAREENERWAGRGAVRVVTESLGKRVAGRTSSESEIVQATIAVSKALGMPINIFPGSTDSNVAMELGVPAVTLDGGGNASGGHSLGEWFDSTDSWKGTQRAMLLVVALAQR